MAATDGSCRPALEEAASKLKSHSILHDYFRSIELRRCFGAVLVHFYNVS